MQHSAKLVEMNKNNIPYITNLRLTYLVLNTKYGWCNIPNKAAYQRVK